MELVCVAIGGILCTHMCGSQRFTQVSFLTCFLPICLFVWTRSRSRPGILTVELTDWPMSPKVHLGPRGSFAVLRYQALHTAFFLWILRIPFRSTSVQGNHSPSWAILPAPLCIYTSLNADRGFCVFFKIAIRPASRDWQLAVHLALCRILVVFVTSASL